MSRTREAGAIMSAISLRSRRSSPVTPAPVAGTVAARSSGRVAPRLISDCASCPKARQTTMLGAAGQETAQGCEQFGLVQQKGVVALVGLDLDEADIRRDGV